MNHESPDSPRSTNVTKMNAIWTELKEFKVGNGNEELTFIQRIANENGWDYEYAKRAYQEYLKFIFLATISDRHVTPSDQVDQVWHLHLCYTQSYWTDLCKYTLGKDIHHGPTKGGEQESYRFSAQYDDTLTLYEKCFKQKPPLDIWPSARDRFDPRNQFVRTSLSEYFVIKKKHLYIITSLACGLLFLSSSDC